MACRVLDLLFLISHSLKVIAQLNQTMYGKYLVNFHFDRWIHRCQDPIWNVYISTLANISQELIRMIYSLEWIIWIVAAYRRWSNVIDPLFSTMPTPTMNNKHLVISQVVHSIHHWVIVFRITTSIISHYRVDAIDVSQTEKQRNNKSIRHDFQHLASIQILRQHCNMTSQNPLLCQRLLLVAYSVMGI